MASDSDEDDHKGEGYIRCLQITVVIYGVVNLIIRGVELTLVIISTSVIVGAYVADINHPHPTFHDYLSGEARHSIWRGPYPSSDLSNVNTLAQNTVPVEMVPALNLSEMLSTPVGVLATPNVTVGGKISAPNATFEMLSGSTVSGTLSGKLSAPNATVAGGISTPNVTVAEKTSAPNVTVAGKISAPNATVGIPSATNVSGMISGPVGESSVGIPARLTASNVPIGMMSAPDAPVGMTISAINTIQEKINIYVWSTYFLTKIIIVVFSFLLICSAKKFSFSGNLAWLVFSIPVLAQNLLQFILDLSFGDYIQRELPSQIWQGVDIGYQLLGVVTVSIFLHLLYHIDDKIRGIDRYNGFPSSRLNGDISITEIIENEDDQRFK